MADPGFSPGGVPTPKVGVLTYFFGRKLHENERICTPGGGCASLAPPLDPPLLRIRRAIKCIIYDVLRSRLGLEKSDEDLKFTVIFKIVPRELHLTEHHSSCQYAFPLSYNIVIFKCYWYYNPRKLIQFDLVFIH